MKLKKLISEILIKKKERIKDMTNYNINTIEPITYSHAAEMAIEKMSIKAHDCFFVDLGGNFGYSVLVFKNAMHIHYANDYELHHSLIVEEKGREGLRKYYIESLNNKLFTDAELMESVSSYDAITGLCAMKD